MPENEPAFLYIEDHAASRSVMEVLIKDVMGYDKLIMLDSSKDVDRVLEQADESFDVIFLDLRIEPVSGYEVLKTLREMPRYARAKMVAVTASALADDVLAAQAAGFDGLIGKPLDIDTFPQYVQRILSGERIWEER